MKLLIVGGYGIFGGRIIQLLENEPRLTILVAGRSLAKAEAWCRSHGNVAATLVPALFDRDGDLAAQLVSLTPDTVVDASGPFQAYGEGRYRLIEACIAGRVNYLDLADGSDFVAGVSSFDAAARQAGVCVLSGVSSFPVLTAAVVRRLTSDMARVDSIKGGIAPSPYAGVGENVIRAIAGYAGQPVELKRDGRKARGYPLTEQMRYTIAPPGRVPVNNTLFSLVDVPDLRALADLWPQARTIWMGAGPVPQILHRALIGLARLVRVGVIRSLSPLAPLMHWATNRLRWGEHRGGMFVEVEGMDNAGIPIRRSWHLLAEGDDGPLIPAMAVEALVRKALDSKPPAPGARAAVNDLEIEDYERLFAGKTIHAGFRDDSTDPGTPLYAVLLGDAWRGLPREIRAMHDRAAMARGRGSVERGTTILSRIVASLVGFPRASADSPVEVRFDTDKAGETWTRTFGTHSFSSRQFAGEGRSQRLLCERFGPLSFAMALVTEDGKLKLVLRRWNVLGLPLPMWLCPRSTSHEAVEDGKFRFHVEISHPLTDLIVRYRGWLEPVDSQGSSTIASPAALASSRQS
ncbi:SDR family NAD(P)-dependent oxidoreductase [Mesorhizobium sp. M00.F.Ca.ET.186.01.1.1]|nr:SDR family NAD(P)-dependent oxidoreductase [bacterium M00.F.Ca.ET.205.01.1.1]TGU54601.1 SDR family NAD(P)-dependent oxidoreductase [bacterium M00.F.Ca.ET.152.01.1.1]TGV38620.1 SDR family NAD(P)-dependent oxidoreductase [Mesorhizobium sp. M00.F.Ca.ET.186.01.1.1]TGZ44173.1 SDR family NAD(P)-dependent oxidoreductase [bacterium M00.F.Ca.ET.162.01.1.1]